MELFSVYLSITLINLAAWITPGPNSVAVVSASMTGGRINGLLTGLGISAANLLWAALAIFGVDTLFSLFPNLILTLRLLGASYLLWLGFNALYKAYTNKTKLLSVKQTHSNNYRAFLNGFLVCTTNPKAALFYGSILTAFVPENTTATVLASIVLLCGLLGIILHSITATVFSTKLVMQKFQQSQRLISVVFGLVFTGFGGGIMCKTLRQIQLSE